MRQSLFAAISPRIDLCEAALGTGSQTTSSVFCILSGVAAVSVLRQPSASYAVKDQPDADWTKMGAAMAINLTAVEKCIASKK